MNFVFFYIFNKIANLMHFLEKTLINFMHVSDCVSTLETEELVSSKTINYIDILYGHEEKSYKLRIPIKLCKLQCQGILSATVNGKHDITGYVESLMGPFNNFYMLPLRVHDIIPFKYQKEFENIEIIMEDLTLHNYSNFNSRIHFHYGLEWYKYDQEEYMKTYNNLFYLDLA